MAVKCNGKVETYSVDMKQGKYDSDPFDPEDDWQKGEAIENFLKKFLEEGKVVCEASCTGGNEGCLAHTLEADIPKGKGTLKRVEANKDKDGTDIIYYMKIQGQLHSQVYS